MKKYFVLVILVILFSCKKDEPKPFACFTLSKTSARVNEVIIGTNCSTNADSYLWTDTDGATATTKNVNLVYSSTGMFTIKLKAYSGAISDEMQMVVTITP